MNPHRPGAHTRAVGRLGRRLDHGMGKGSFRPDESRVGDNLFSSLGKFAQALNNPCS